jgi:hypothetical protein
MKTTPTKHRISFIARLSIPLAAVIAALVGSPQVHAVDLYWDPNGTTSDFGTATVRMARSSYWGKGAY